MEQAQLLLDLFAGLNYRKAKERALEKQVSQAAGDMEFYLVAGCSYGELGQWEQAGGKCMMVLERDSGHASDLAGLGYSYLNQQNLEEAVALDCQAVARAPD